MLTALGVAAVIVAGFALPLAVGGGPEDEDDPPAPRQDPPPEGQEADGPGGTAPNGDAASPLDVALARQSPAPAAPDMPRDGTGASPASEQAGSANFAGPDPDGTAPGSPGAQAQGASGGRDPDMAGTPSPPPGGEGARPAPEERDPALVPDDAAETAGERSDGGAAWGWLVGSDGADDIAGGRGDDTLSGAGGDDLIFGGGGDDVLEGGAGNDRLADGNGSNTMAGGAGDDRLIATPADGAGADAGPDSLDGGAGDDTLTFSAGDTATGGAGADMFVTSLGLAPPGVAAGPAEIADFDPDHDALVVVWDDYAADHPPKITLSASAAEDATEVRADGEVVARVTGAGPLAASDVHLVPTSQFVA